MKQERYVIKEGDRPEEIDTGQVSMGLEDKRIGWEVEWQNMPAFIQEKLEPFAEIIVRIRTESDLKQFADLLNQTINPKSSIWYPKMQFREEGFGKNQNMAWIDDGKSDDLLDREAERIKREAEQEQNQFAIEEQEQEEDEYPLPPEPNGLFSDPANPPDGADFL